MIIVNRSLLSIRGYIATVSIINNDRILSIHPRPQRDFKLGDEVCVIETSLGQFPLCAPISGRLIEFNPRVIRSYGFRYGKESASSWIYRLQLRPECH